MDPIEELLLRQVRDKYSQNDTPHPHANVSIENLLLQKVREKYSYIELPNTVSIAPISPLQTLLSTKIASTFSTALSLTFTTALTSTLITSPTSGHDLDTMRFNRKSEKQGFEQYSRFPLEIQRKIWICTLPGPRVTAIKYDDQNNTCESTSLIPVALHVCSVSRTEALRFYSLSFGTTSDNGRIYFRFGFDIPLLLTNVFINVGPSRLPVERLESFINSTRDLEKLDMVAMIPGLIKSVFGPPPRPRPNLCNTIIERMPTMKYLLSANCTKETDELCLGMSGYLANYKTIGTKKCSDLSLVMKAYALSEDAQRRTDNFKKYWGVHWCQSYLELHGLPLVLVPEEDLEDNVVKPFSRVGNEWGIAPSIRSVLYHSKSPESTE
ncbi:hypothetical protein NHQ30_005632 [Ciborinia camelliae]|nr:hypothetical protein NHQ30_005632 [Ciborinia camelliae]